MREEGGGQEAEVMKGEGGGQEVGVVRGDGEDRKVERDMQGLDHVLEMTSHQQMKRWNQKTKMKLQAKMRKDK